MRKKVFENFDIFVFFWFRCFLNHFDSILILIISMLIFIFLLLIILLSARNYIKQLTKKTIQLSDQSEKSLLTKPNEILPVLISSNKTNEQDLTKLNLYHTNIDNQQESINQLLSILSQLILLIFLFLSCLSMYLHPLHSFHFHFEDIIYSHLYGFFLLFLTFYILSFYVTSRVYFHRKKTHHLFNQSSSSSRNSMINEEHDIPSIAEQSLPPLHSHYASTVCVYEVPPNTERTSISDDNMCPIRRLTNITSSFYACQRDAHETNLSQTIPDQSLPVSSLDTSSQE